MKDPILIIGCARSGTSMTAGLIHICGAFGGEMFGPNQFNQRGMFENVDIRTNIVKPYLKKIGVDPLGQRPLTNNRQVFEVSQAMINRWRVMVQQTMLDQGYKDGEWFYKCPKSAMIWYLWHKAFPEAKWIVVHREHKDIIKSCLKTKFLRAYQTAEGWQGWIDQHEKRFEEMKIAGVSIIHFWPSRMITGDFEYAKEMIESVGLVYNDSLCRAFIEPNLFNRG